MCLIFIYNVCLNLHGGTSSVFTSYAHHMQQYNDYTCSVIATVLQYRGFSRQCGHFYAVQQESEWSSCAINQLCTLSPVMNYYIFRTNSIMTHRLS